MGRYPQGGNPEPRSLAVSAGKRGVAASENSFNSNQGGLIHTFGVLPMPSTSTLYVCRPFRKTDLVAVVDIERRVQWDHDDPHSWSWAHYADWHRQPSNYGIRVVSDVQTQEVWAVACFIQSKTELVIYNYAHINRVASAHLWRWLVEFAAGRRIVWHCAGGPVNE